MDELHPRIRTALVSINPTTEHPAWHGVPTALGVLRGVNARVAVWRPYPEANNIREIALHIAFYENGLANRLSGQNLKAGFKQRKSGWAQMEEQISEEQWKEEVKLIKSIHERLVEALTGFDPELLDQPAGVNTSFNASINIHGVAEHSLYHTAQMELTKTLAKHQGVGQEAK